MWGQPPPAVRWSDSSIASELTMTTPLPTDPNSTETFPASRWTQGNFFFPTKLTINAQRVARVKSKFFGSNEESIPISKVASVHISTGVFWAEIVIESTGGTYPSTRLRHRKPDAQRILAFIDIYQVQ